MRSNKKELRLQNLDAFFACLLNSLCANRDETRKNDSLHVYNNPVARYTPNFRERNRINSGNHSTTRDSIFDGTLEFLPMTEAPLSRHGV